MQTFTSMYASTKTPPGQEASSESHLRLHPSPSPSWTLFKRPHARTTHLQQHARGAGAGQAQDKIHILEKRHAGGSPDAGARVCKPKVEPTEPDSQHQHQPTKQQGCRTRRGPGPLICFPAFPLSWVCACVGGEKKHSSRLASPTTLPEKGEIGRASCRERVF